MRRHSHTKLPKAMSQGEAMLSRQLDQLKIEYQREYRFHPVRQWRFDFAIPEKKIAIEVEGGTWAGGRHNSGAGFRGDCIKYNAATAMGWKVFRYTTDLVEAGRASQEIAGLL